MVRLLPFQREFLAAVENPAYDTVALSGPRGLSKTFLAAQVLIRCLTPGDPLHQPGMEYVLGAASLEQARMAYSFIRLALEGTGEYRWIDSTTRLGATHKESNTKLRAISSNGKTAFGLVNVGVLVLDEPGGLEIAGGQVLADAIFTAQGKAGSKLKVVMIGTLGPMATYAGHWWYDMVSAGTKGSVWVKHFQGDLDSWDNWHTIRKANPLVNVDAGFRKKLLSERDEARKDTRLKARFLTYRLNIPSGDEVRKLLTVDDYQLALTRPVGERSGRPIVGADMGAGRAWSAATAIYPSGRVECIAVAPGIPSISDQERRDLVPKGTYQRLVDSGRLLTAEGLRVQPAAMLAGAIRSEWGIPAQVLIDRFRFNELLDVAGGLPVEARVTRWSESSADIRSLRRMAADGPMSIDPASRLLLETSLTATDVETDTSGNHRLIKKGSANTGRDDTSAALVLAAGAWDRARTAVAPRARLRSRAA
ncbi:MAG: hypothetical protein OXF79_12140 [Chloroflexi bacterium]|nr:hypothetical protein [Chloroflexota bacterium]